MGKYIEHKGIVIAHTETGKYQIKITQLSACASCKVANLCSAAESKEKIIEAYTTHDNIKIGDTVIIYGQKTMGYKALLLAIIIPLIISLLTLVIIQITTHNEIISGLSALLILIPYYSIISLFRNKLQQKFIFYIKEI